MTGLVYYFIFFPKELKFTVIDHFIKSDYSANVVFVFTEVNYLDSAGMYDAGRHISRNRIGEFISDDKLTIMIIHFYEKSAGIDVPAHMMRDLRNKFPKAAEYSNRLLYIESGYIYTHINKKVKNLNMPQDTIFPGYMFIPKKGFKAKEIFRSF
ncbi:MAG: hypothetical protein ACLFR2_11990 [Candidatus Kapaibacterium sp.]